MTDAAGYGQANACTHLVLVELYELLEDMLSLTGRNTNACILDDVLHHVVLLTDSQRDAALLGEALGIVEQHDEGMYSGLFVGLYRQLVDVFISFQVDGNLGILSV